MNDKAREALRELEELCDRRSVPSTGDTCCTRVEVESYADVAARVRRILQLAARPVCRCGAVTFTVPGVTHALALAPTEMTVRFHSAEECRPATQAEVATVTAAPSGPFHRSLSAHQRASRYLIRMGPDFQENFDGLVAQFDEAEREAVAAALAGVGGKP